MNIYFDARWTRVGRHDGVSRYGASLLEALAKQHPVTMLICDDRQLDMLPNVPHIKVNSPFSPAELLLPRKLNKLGADVVFSPLQVMGFWGHKYKLILTLQDTIYYHYPKPPTNLPAPIRLVWWLFHQAYWPQRWLLNHADYITTVSETSKKFIQQFHLTDRPIGVIYNAPPKLTRHQAPNAKPKKELVYMGTFMPYKNAELLVKAMEYLPGYKLNLASRVTPQRKAELLKLAGNPEQIVFWNGISDEDYYKLLKSSTALVTASKHEGFGLPLVEAMSHGVPVACSDMEVFHEVCGPAGLYFDYDDPQSVAKQITKLEDPKVYKRYAQAGLERAKKFSWENSARKLLGIIDSLT